MSTVIQKLKNNHNVKIVVIAAVTGMRAEVLSRKIKSGELLSVNSLVDWFASLLLKAVEEDRGFAKKSYHTLRLFGVTAVRKEVVAKTLGGRY